MGLKEIFTITRKTKLLIVVLACISITGFLIAYFYYDYRNKAEDPRIVAARYKLKKFDDLMKARMYEQALFLLDTIDSIYRKADGYATSFEPGIVFNNRGSIYLSMALYDSLISQEERQHLLALADTNLKSGIEIYMNWIDSAGALPEQQIRKNIEPYFNESVASLKGKNIHRIFNKRVADIMNAQIETPRRLSVCYTNLGIVQRHQLRQEEALKSYIQAIKLWKDNFTARNNFNVLMGKPPEDRSIIDQLFPPERIKKD
ncbi:MAG TPA: hypothetical protein PKW80_15780 [Bacteroidales bacterium]|nr:hypothetical protein [Bacteroidales bacterium]